MDDFSLPPELEELQHELAIRPTPVPSEALRRRVMADIQAELQVRTVVSATSTTVSSETDSNGEMPAWQFAAAVAVVVAFWFNLSLSASQATDYGLRIEEERPVPSAMIRQLATQDEWPLPVGNSRLSITDKAEDRGRRHNANQSYGRNTPRRHGEHGEK